MSNKEVKTNLFPSPSLLQSFLGKVGQLAESDPNPPPRYKRPGNPNSVGPFTAYLHDPANRARWQVELTEQQIPADGRALAVKASQEWKQLSDLEKERWADRAREKAATKGAGPMSGCERCRSREGLSASFAPCLQHCARAIAICG